MFELIHPNEAKEGRLCIGLDLSFFLRGTEVGEGNDQLVKLQGQMLSLGPISDWS